MITLTTMEELSNLRFSTRQRASRREFYLVSATSS